MFERVVKGDKAQKVWLTSMRGKRSNIISSIIITRLIILDTMSALLCVSGPPKIIKPINKREIYKQGKYYPK